MGDVAPDTLDPRAALPQIDRAWTEARKFQAEHDKLTIEQLKLAAEQAKFAAETAKLYRDRAFAPWQIAATCMAAGAAFWKITGG